MAVLQETEGITKILQSVRPTQTGVEANLIGHEPVVLDELAEVGDARLVYGIFPYQLRLAGFGNQPLLSGRWTRQPVVALEIGRGTERVITPLPYATNVRELGAPLATVVVNHLAAVGSR